MHLITHVLSSCTPHWYFRALRQNMVKPEQKQKVLFYSNFVKLLLNSLQRKFDLYFCQRKWYFSSHLATQQVKYVLPTSESVDEILWRCDIPFKWNLFGTLLFVYYAVPTFGAWWIFKEPTSWQLVFARMTLFMFQNFIWQHEKRSRILVSIFVFYVNLFVFDGFCICYYKKEKLLTWLKFQRLQVKLLVGCYLQNWSM